MTSCLVQLHLMEYNEELILYLSGLATPTDGPVPYTHKSHTAGTAEHPSTASLHFEKDFLCLIQINQAILPFFIIWNQL